MKRATYLLALAASCVFALAAAPSCGSDADDGGGNVRDAGAAGGVDGAPSSDCELFFVPPTDATLGEPVEVSVLVSGANFGIQTFTWTIELAGAAQNITELSNPAERVSFTPSAAGAYRIVVEADIGSERCTPALGTVGIVAPGARSEPYRMRVVPTGGAPMQDVAVEVFGGADAVLADTVLEPGFVALGRIVDSGDAPVAAYIRARSRAGGAQADYEAFSAPAGDFRLHLPEGQFDLLVVPQSQFLPSQKFSDLSASEVGSVLSLSPAVALSGQLFTADGVGLAGASVSVLVDGARSTVATTNGDGTFSVFATGSALTGIAVAPPASSGLPALRADALAGQVVDEASSVRIRYAIASVPVALDVTDSQGAPEPGATVEWRSDVAVAGSVEVIGVEAVSGTLRLTATTDGVGHLERNVLAANASLVAQASDGGEARILSSIDWGIAPVSALALEELATESIVAELLGSAAIGATVDAVPTGVLAPQAPVRSGLTNAKGLAALQLVRGGTYQLNVRHPTAGLGYGQIVDAGSGAGIAPLALPGTILAEGRLSVGVTGGSLEGAQVRLFCDECAGADAERVHASAVVDPSGRYVFRVADPGVDAAE